MIQSQRIEALERKLQVLHAFVEGNNVALREFKKEVRDEKRFDELFSLTNQTQSTCDKNMQVIVMIHKDIARQESQIKEYKLTAEVSQKKLQEDIEMGYRSSIDAAIAKIENQLKESLNIQN